MADIIVAFPKLNDAKNLRKLLIKNGYDVNMVCDLTRRFVRAMYVGRNLVRDVEEIRTCIHENYLGASARALATATRSARMKYLDCIQKERK